MKVYNVDTVHVKDDKIGESMNFQPMMTSSNGNIFRITGPLCGEFTGHQLIHRTKASDAGLCDDFLINAWINGCVNTHEAGDLRCHCIHYDISAMRKR